MATIKFYEPTNMLAFDWKYAFPTDTSHLQSTIIYDSSNFDTGDTVVYRGVFAYNSIPNGLDDPIILGLRSGTLTGYEWYDDQILRVKMTGLNYDAIDAFIYMQLSQPEEDNFAYSGELMAELLSGNDKIVGSSFSDVLNGFDGDDTINGGRRLDVISGNDGNDTISGDAGQDVLIGGLGADTISGGTGKDTFQFNSVKEAGDTITDFSRAAGDSFAFSAAGFGTDLSAGTLSSAQFQSNISPDALTADVRFIYDSDDFRLYFDADGNGASAAVLVAFLQSGAVVNASDILLV